jgi:hypothetical protein
MDGTSGEMRLGNTKLINYGIQTEKSDFHAHVSITAQAVYIFPTQAGMEAIKTGEYRKVNVYTGNIITAVGYPIPVNKIQGIQRTPIPKDLFISINFQNTDTTTVKGEKAIAVVKGMLKRGLIAINLQSEEINDTDMQIDGTDIIVTARAKFQVKCDWRAGDNGTGNIFLQVAECNPFSMH